MPEQFTLKDQIKNYLSNLRDQMSKNAALKFTSEESDMKQYILSDEQIEKFSEKAIAFIEDSNEMSRMWHGEELTKLRMEEMKIQGPSPVYKIKCIDGRKPRGYEGEAHSLKSEKAQLALSRNKSTGQLIPLGADICVNLSDPTEEPVEMSLAHYDSVNSHQGCAAMGLVLKDFLNNISSTWQFLTPDEIRLIQSAADRSLAYSNLLLLELTNKTALDNIHNDYRLLQGYQPLKHVAITALFDTRTMGIELWTPLIIKNDTQLSLPEENDIKKLSTTLLTRKYADMIAGLKNAPKMGIFRDNFAHRSAFTEYSKSLVNLSRQLSDKSTPLTSTGNELFVEVADFISQYYPEYTPNQQQAIRYRIIRTIVHQYLTALHLAPEKHLYSDHGEKFISIAEDGNYPGKYLIEYQCFRMSGPDITTSARRLQISASVMDSINVDQGQPHVAFFSTSISQSDYEHRNDPLHNEKYKDARRESIKFYKGLMENTLFRSLVESKNTIPIPLLTIRETGEVVKVLSSNALYY